MAIRLSLHAGRDNHLGWGYVSVKLIPLDSGTECHTYTFKSYTGDELVIEFYRYPTVIDRAVHNSPAPLDDVGGCDPNDFDEEDPNSPWPQS
jgi:hypothetical protein